MTDVVWQALIAGGVTLGLGYMSYRTQRSVAEAAVAAARKAEEQRVAAAAVATKVETVATKLAVQDEKTDKKLQAIHTLVNGPLGALLKDAAETKRRLAALSGRPEDAEAAKLASQASDAHTAQAAINDRSIDGNAADAHRSQQ